MTSTPRSDEELDLLRATPAPRGQQDVTMSLSSGLLASDAVVA